jgi:hypothetical protein
VGNVNFGHMGIQKNTGLDFEIDKLTNSIENVVTGDSFATEVSVLLKEELKNVSKSKGWLLTGKKSSSIRNVRYTN